MLTVLNCIYGAHNHSLVVIAALLCCSGSYVTMRLLRRAVHASSAQRLGWHFLAAVAGGGSVWATHFVSMLAYEPQVPISFEPAMTILSLVVAMVGLFFSFFLSGLFRSPILQCVGGAFAGLSFSAMHYTGMFGYRVTGMVQWNQNFIWGSILMSVICSTVAVWLIWRPRLSSARFFVAIGAMVVGIIGLHFTGMTALTVTPMTHNIPQIDAQALIALALSIAVVALIIVGTGLTSYLIDSNIRASSAEQMHHMAGHDALTGLPNRASFGKYLSEAIKCADELDIKLAVIGIDLNRFKEINDTMGHAAGDETLRVLADRMTRILKEDEFVARIGGDEFAAIKYFRDRQDVVAFAQRLSVEIAQPISVGTMDASVGASLGAAIWPDDGRAPEELVNNADLAMYQAKNALLEELYFYNTEIAAEMRKRRQLGEALKVALERDELTLHYQVQKSLRRDQSTIGFEALLRWTSSEFGPVSPAEFIPIAEENGLIAAIGEWVMRRACLDAAGWENPVRVAVNVSAVQFMNARLPQLVHEILIDTGLQPDRLELELTETALVKDKVRSLHVIRQIKALGVKVALDDFGIGYSSLEILRAFPFDKVKLDKSFIDEIDQDLQALSIVRAVLALGKSLEIPVLAEGIETQTQAAILAKEGCDAGQGFLLGRPKSVKDQIHIGELMPRQLVVGVMGEVLSDKRQHKSEPFDQSRRLVG